MNLETYERHVAADYADLAATVATILTAAIQSHPNSLRLQQVQHRPKNPDSLRKKLEKLGALDSSKIENIVKDLAGCRLVFYTNSDVSQFLSSRIVSDNFDIDWDRTKFHQPGQNPSSAADLFTGVNYVIRLSDQRIALPEYARFRGMLCEIQVQTTLNHAWSEMAHDTIYKKPALKGFGGSLMTAIEERMKTIMRDFLVPAGYEFQKVLSDFERLSLGKELFDQGALDCLSQCNDNNSLYDFLKRLDTYVLPNYDDLQSVQAEIRKAVISAVERARGRATQSIDTPFGTLPGHTIEQVVGVAADILDHLRYLNEEAVEATFDAICQLFAGADSDDERKRLLQSAQDLAKHELRIWKVAGPLVQHLLVERIRRLPADGRARIKPIAIEILGKVLHAEVTGTTGTYNTITLQRGPVTASDMLRNTRSGAIAVLKDYFKDAETDAERRIVAQQLNTATMAPYVGNYSNNLQSIVLDNTREIIDFYTEVADKQSYEILQAFEHDALWLFRRNRRLPAEMEADANIADSQHRLINSILVFRDHLTNNRRFNIYKTLVGYQSVFPPAWEDDKFEIQEQEAYRSRLIIKLVEEVTVENADEWHAILLRCVQTESNDLATFPSLGQFLEELGCSKPEVVISYLDRLTDRLANFLPSILGGLEKGGNTDVVNKKVEHWISTVQYLRQIIRYLRFSATFNIGTLEQALRAAITCGDDVAVLVTVETVANRHEPGSGSLIGTALLPAIEYLTAKSDTRWIDAMWIGTKAKALAQDLMPEQVEVLLANLVQRSHIDFHTEAFLKPIAARFPEKVVDFFGERLEHEPKDADTKGYEAVPFQLHELHVPLQAIPDYLVQTANAWFEKDEVLFSYRGGRLLSIVFPTLSPELESALLRFLQPEDADIHFIVMVLRSYHHGGTFLHNVCKRVVELLPEEDEMLGEIGVVLDATGVVSGEFGFVEAYKRKKVELKPWLNDPCEKVRSFASRHLLGLDRKIAFEQRRAEEELEMRKRDYGESGNDDDEQPAAPS